MKKNTRSVRPTVSKKAGVKKAAAVKTAAKAKTAGHKTDKKARTAPVKTKRPVAVKVGSEETPNMRAEVEGRAKEVLKSEIFCDYISKNVGSKANELLAVLASKPRADEALAEVLNLKLNETRRMLNMLNSFGIARYDANKDSNGWLTFEWYVDPFSVCDMFVSVSERANAKKNVLPDNCNDFFICNECYKKQKVIFPFDAACENNFKCGCGKNLEMLTRSEAEVALQS